MATACEETSDDFILQPLVNPADYSLSVFCVDGKLWAATLWRAVAYGRERFGMPVLIEFVEQPAVLEEGRKAMKTLRWSGVCDMDFLVEENNPRVWLLEINGRFWGSLPACTAAGVDFPRLMCEYAESGTLSARCAAQLRIPLLEGSGGVSRITPPNRPRPTAVTAGPPPRRRGPAA